MYNSPFDYSDEADPLEMRIADAAHAAEDVIDSYIVDNINHLATKTNHHADVDLTLSIDCNGMYKAENAIKSNINDLAAKTTHHANVDGLILSLDFNGMYNSLYGCSDRANMLEMCIADATYATEDVIESDIVDNINDIAAKTPHHADVDGLILSLECNEIYNSLYGCSDEADPLEMRNADAAYVAEDVIELNIVDYLANIDGTLADDDNDGDGDARADVGDSFNCNIFYEDVKKVIEEMDLINKEVKNMDNAKVAVEPQLKRKVRAAGFRSTSIDRKNGMVGFDDQLLQLSKRLTNFDGQLERQIIPIVGMGGIGKTTLAKNVFERIKDHFDVCAWATISQDYNIRETLSELLSRLRVDENEGDLVTKIHQELIGRRYLVIIDDIWSIEAWDEMKLCLPECGNGSRIIVTTRLLNLATQLTDRNSVFNMKFLDEVNCWTLFSNVVFGKETCPLELAQIGKSIVDECNGLPLSIVVIGGLLAKSPHTHEYWKDIEENLSLALTSENDEYCLRILRMSYIHLPVYLKPCFLYMGVFDEDDAVKVSKLVKLWVSEGFLKPRDNNKSLESIGEEYLEDLIERNLILVDGLGSLGKVKYCKTHDLVRELCLKEAKKQGLFYVLRDQDSTRGGSDTNRPRRVVIDSRFSDEKEIPDDLKSMSHVRSFLSVDREELPDYRLLRILDVREEVELKNRGGTDIFKYVNSRYIDVYLASDYCANVNSSINLLWNLQTLLAPPPPIEAIDIWRMHQLRHVNTKYDEFKLMDPPRGRGDNDIVIMENLQTLKTVESFNLDAEVVRRIPNLKKLGVRYYELKQNKRVNNCLSHLECLSKLEIFTCLILNGEDELLHNMTFPKSLKKLSLEVEKKNSEYFGWEDILQKIGRLPLLQKLKLSNGYFRTRKWETIDGHFPNLKILELWWCGGLENWIVSVSCHFPLLQELHLSELKELEEIPSAIGEIPTLNSIVLYECSRSARVSAHNIVEEQRELQDELDLHVRVTWYSIGDAEYLQSLANPNFHIDFF